MGHHHGERFPRPLLIGAGLLIGFSLLAAMAGRLSGIGVTELPPGVAVQERLLHFQDRAGGGVVVIDARSNELVRRIDPAEQGFVSGVLRGFARERRLGGVDQAPPMVLTRWADGRLSLHDPSTGRIVALEAFGPGNAAAFARLMPELDLTASPDSPHNRS